MSSDIKGKVREQKVITYSTNTCKWKNRQHFRCVSQYSRFQSLMYSLISEECLCIWQLVYFSTYIHWYNKQLLRNSAMPISYIFKQYYCLLILSIGLLFQLLWEISTNSHMQKSLLTTVKLVKQKFRISEVKNINCQQIASSTVSTSYMNSINHFA